MRLPQVVVFEADGRLAAALQPLADERACALRAFQQPGACLRALRRGGPSVLVLRVGRDLEREFALLDRATRSEPAARCLVALDRDDDRLSGLAYDLGAACVLPPGRLRDLLPDCVAALLGGP